MKNKGNQTIILASTSPRRKELMEKLNLPFIIEAPDYEEDMTLKVPPIKLAKILAMGKALSVAKKHKEGIVIGADTFVALKNHLLGKPKSEIEAKKMLKKISGQEVDVITGMAIIDVASRKKISKIAITRVFIRKLTNEEIDNYIASGEPMDKAGAFAIQSLGAVIIRKIEGDFIGALGLSLFVLAKELKKFGIHAL
jgi:septum formation protein